MPEDLANQISDIFNAMGMTIIQTLLIYFVLPILVVSIVSGRLFKLRGLILKVVIVGTVIVSFYFLATVGFPQMTETYNSYLNNK